MPTSSARATNNAPPGAGEQADELDDELDDEETAPDEADDELAPVRSLIRPSQSHIETEEEDVAPQTHFVEPDSAEAAEERARLVGPTPNPVNAASSDDPASIICSVCNNPYGVFRQDPFTGKYIHSAVTDCMLNQQRPNPMLLR